MTKNTMLLGLSMVMKRSGGKPVSRLTYRQNKAKAAPASSTIEGIYGTWGKAVKAAATCGSR